MSNVVQKISKFRDTRAGLEIPEPVVEVGGRGSVQVLIDHEGQFVGVLARRCQMGGKLKDSSSLWELREP